MQGATRNQDFVLPHGSYSVFWSEYFECVIKKHETLTDKSPVQIYVHKIQNRIT